LSFRDQAIILRTVDFGESDRIFSVYTPKHGKVSVFVPGARHSKKRFAQALDLFCTFEGVFHSRRSSASNLFRLGEFEYLDIGVELRQSWQQIIYGSLMIESVQKLTVESDPHPKLFELLSDFLHRLGKIKLTPQTLDLPIYLLRLLWVLGFLPELRRCVRCERKLDEIAQENPYYFVQVEGGLICEKCFRLSPTQMRPAQIDISALKAMQKTLYGDIAPERIRLQPRVVMQLHQLALQMVESIAGRELRSHALFYLLFSENLAPDSPSNLIDRKFTHENQKTSR
jgi:DNA repair protein RecO (recombination protein O)